MSQQHNPQSLRDVVRHLLERARTRVDEAVASVGADIVGDEDTEELLGGEAEAVMFASVTGETEKSRTDRQTLHPWLRFRWEIFRHILDVLRNNNRFEELYAVVARAAFTYAERFERRKELRTLADLLRSHLGIMTKYQHQTQSVQLSIPESRNRQIDLRCGGSVAVGEGVGGGGAFDYKHVAPVLEE